MHLHAREIELLIRSDLEFVVVVLEALRDSPSAIEDERADECARPVSLRYQTLRKRLVRVRERCVTVEPDAVRGPNATMTRASDRSSSKTTSTLAEK